MKNWEKKEKEGQELGAKRIFRGQLLGKRPDCYIRVSDLSTTTLSTVLGVEVRVIQEMSS